MNRDFTALNYELNLTLVKAGSRHYALVTTAAGVSMTLCFPTAAARDAWTATMAGTEVSVVKVGEYRVVRNLMSQKEVLEDVDTPWSCSVASESYWCN